MEDTLRKIVVKFMKENKVDCEETIYQTDRVILNAYDFMADLYNAVKDDMADFIPPHYEDLVDYFKSKNATVSVIHQGGDMTVWFTVKFEGKSVEVDKHVYYYMEDDEKRDYLRRLEEVLGIE